jgi:anti-anti-sigma factor
MATPYLDIEEIREAGGSVGLAVSGELDLASAPRLEARLKALRREHGLVRLDLSKLTFIDSTGIRLLILALDDARQDGWNLEVGGELTPPVRRVLELVRLDRLILGEDD